MNSWNVTIVMDRQEDDEVGPGPRIRFEQDDDRLVIYNQGLRLAFVRRAGRWVHHLALGEFAEDLSESDQLISALECDPDRDDPTRVVSPVFQELHHHHVATEQGDGPCLLLTGHWFQHHFSASVTVSGDAGRPDSVMIDFDIADRCRSTVSALAATYLVRLGSGDLADASPEGIQWSGNALGAGRLAMACVPPGTLALAESGRVATRVQALAAIEGSKSTHRLRYFWRWDSNSGRTR